MLSGARSRPCLLLCLVLGLCACAGYRGGWESRAYIGPTPPAGEEDPSSAGNRPAMTLPGLQLEIAIDNQLRTYDTQVYLFVLPLSIDPRRVYPRNHEPGKTRVHVTVTPSEPGFVFRPERAVLHIGEQHFAGSAGFEFGMWNAEGQRVREGGAWAHRPVGTHLPLSEPGRKYLLSIDFPTPVPSPESRDLSLDLSRALVSPRQPAVPLIRFAPVRWKQGYT